MTTFLKVFLHVGRHTAGILNRFQFLCGVQWLRLKYLQMSLLSNQIMYSNSFFFDDKLAAAATQVLESPLTVNLNAPLNPNTFDFSFDDSVQRFDPVFASLDPQGPFQTFAASNFQEPTFVPDYGVMKQQNQFLFYPDALSPPDTPEMRYLAANTQQFEPDFDYQLERQRSDSVSWPATLPAMASMHHRTLSLPHIAMPMDFTTRRASTVSSIGSSDRNFPCTHQDCDRSFSRIQNLRSHMRCHLETTPHNCDSCGLGFRRTTDLQRHVRTMHTPNDQKPWPCKKCPKRFGRSDALKRHMTSRSKDHSCPGGVDMDLVRQMDEQKRMKTVLENL